MDIDSWTHWIVWYKEQDDGTRDVYHMVGTEGYPNEETVGHLTEEVRYDEEFGLGDTMDELEMVILDKEEGMEVASELPSSRIISP